MCFEIFELMKVMPLYWFAADQENSSFIREEMSLPYSKFRAQLNELSLNVLQ